METQHKRLTCGGVAVALAIPLGLAFASPAHAAELPLPEAIGYSGGLTQDCSGEKTDNGPLLVHLTEAGDPRLKYEVHTENERGFYVTARPSDADDSWSVNADFPFGWVRSSAQLATSSLVELRSGNCVVTLPTPQITEAVFDADGAMVAAPSIEVPENTWITHFEMQGTPAPGATVRIDAVHQRDLEYNDSVSGAGWRFLDADDATAASFEYTFADAPDEDQRVGVAFPAPHLTQPVRNPDGSATLPTMRFVGYPADLGIDISYATPVADNIVEVTITIDTELGYFTSAPAGFTLVNGGLITGTVEFDALEDEEGDEDTRSVVSFEALDLVQATRDADGTVTPPRIDWLSEASDSLELSYSVAPAPGVTTLATFTVTDSEAWYFTPDTIPAGWTFVSETEIEREVFFVGLDIGSPGNEGEGEPTPAPTPTPPPIGVNSQVATDALVQRESTSVVSSNTSTTTSANRGVVAGEVFSDSQPAALLTIAALLGAAGAAVAFVFLRHRRHVALLASAEEQVFTSDPEWEDRGE